MLTAPETLEELKIREGYLAMMYEFTVNEPTGYGGTRPVLTTLHVNKIVSMSLTKIRDAEYLTILSDGNAEQTFSNIDAQRVYDDLKEWLAKT